jgi:hypothetical protein
MIPPYSCSNSPLGGKNEMGECMIEKRNCWGAQEKRLFEHKIAEEKTD